MRVSIVLVGLALFGCRKDGGPADADGDGTPDAQDCAPFDAAAFPGGIEVCDSLDNDCNGVVDDAPTDGATWYFDADHDGFGDSSSSAMACQAPPGDVANGDDCNDRDPATHPGAPELDCTDNTDYNCDRSVGYADADGDGAPACNDCDDANKDIGPAATEMCDGVDDNCDGLVDNDAEDASEYAIDIDNDGHGNPRYTVFSCDPVDGYVPIANADDCDDLEAATFPGAPEDCDGRDNDCNGQIDDGATGKLPYYPDVDQDGYGDPSGEVTACSRPPGYVSNFGDCDDADPAYNPGANETCSDLTDYNCDGSVGQDDHDGDGVVACDDCDDSRVDVHPGAVELCDGIDNNCDGTVDEVAPTWYVDVDGDGHGGSRQQIVSCDQPSGYVSSFDDCDDLDARTYPGATERCDGADNDCDGSPGTDEVDADHDGFMVCEADCDDGNAFTSPVGREVCNGVDDDCDGFIDEAGSVDAQTWYIDVDGDGYGSASRTASGCTAPSGFVGNAADCNDASNAANPGAPEVCDGVDNDCDGEIDEPSASDAATFYADSDGDGVGSAVSTRACAAPAGFVSTTGDCDDGDPNRKPGAPERCNGLDDDCANGVPANETDGDGDGYRACADCDDANALTHPGAVEICDNKDNNCNGTTDEGAVGGNLYWRDAEGDGYGTTNQSTSACSVPSGYSTKAGDCDDTASTVHPGAAQGCDDVDHDCNGLIDNDWDRDGLSSSVCGGKDCNDYNPAWPDKSGNCAYLSCLDALNNGQTTSGVYSIDPDGSGADNPFDAYCDQVRDGGGWTLLMKQKSGSGYTSPLAGRTWTGWSTPRQTMNPTDATLGDSYMVNLAYTTLFGTTLRMTASSTWVDVPSGAFTRTVNSTAYDALKNSAATTISTPVNPVTTPWPAAPFTDNTWTSTTTGNGLCWRTGPYFNISNYEYAFGVKWGYYFNNECSAPTTDTVEGLGCCDNASWYRQSPWTLYVWIK